MGDEMIYHLDDERLALDGQQGRQLLHVARSTGQKDGGRYSWLQALPQEQLNGVGTIANCSFVDHTIDLGQ
jgi:hypothetical protein